MKFKSLGTLTCGLLMCGVLASCKPIASNNPKNFVDANLNEIDKGEPKHFEKINFDHSISDLSNYEIVNSTYKRQGILFVKNSEGYLGVYSLTHNKFILNCSYFADYLNYEVKTNLVGAFIKFDYENDSLIIDNLGNVLYDREYTGLWNIEFDVINGVSYINLHTDSTNNIYKYENGIFSTSYEIPEIEIEPSEPDDEVERHKYKVGDFFKEGIIDLKNIGLDGYYFNCSSNGITTLFDENNKAIQTFALKLNQNPILTRDGIYYQETIPVVKDDQNFDFYLNNVKVDLKTYKLNYFTGEIKEVDVNFLIEDFEIRPDYVGQFTNIIASIKKINEHNLLEESREYLLDSNLNILTDFTELEKDSFIKLDEGTYYNQSTKILYDENLNVLNYLSSMNPTFLPTHQYFKGAIDGKQGMVDGRGNVVIPFEYEEIIFDDQLANAILRKNNTYSLFDLNAKTIKELGIGTLRIIDRVNQYYALEIEYNIKFFSLDGTIKELSIPNNGSYKGSYPILCLNDINGIVVDYDNQYNLNRVSNDFFFKYGDNEVTCNTIGEEDTTRVITGKNYEDAIMISTGTQYIHPNPYSNYTYLKIESPETGYYDLYNNGLFNFELVQVDLENQYGKNTIFESRFDGDDYVFLTNEFNYYFKIDIDDYQEITLTKEIDCEAFSDNYEYIYRTVLKEITPQNDGYYLFEGGENVSYDIIKTSNYGYENVDPTTYNYEGGDVMYLTSGVRYFFTINSSGDNVRLSAYTTETLHTIENNVSFEVLGRTRTLRKLDVKETGVYTIETNATNYEVLVNYSGTLYPVTIDEYSYFNTISLEKDNEYFIRVSNNSFEQTSVNFSINLMSYDSLTYRDLENSKIHVRDGEKTAYRFNVSKTGRYEKIITNYAYPYIYELTAEGSLTQIEEEQFNGTTIYNLEKDKNYIIYADNVYSSDSSGYDFNLNYYDYTDLQSLSASNKYLNGTRYTKFESSSKGFYKFNVSNSSIETKIYHYDYINSTYDEILPTYKNGETYYLLDSYSKYVVVTNDFNNDYSYSINATFYKNTLVGNGNVYYSRGDWTDNGNGVYSSTNTLDGTSSTIEFRIQESGILHFNHDISSEYSDHLNVYVNNYSRSIEYSSGMHEGAHNTLSVSSGDVVKFVYRKNSSISEGLDKVTIYNLWIDTESTTVYDAYYIESIPSVYANANNYKVVIEAWSGIGTKHLYFPVESGSTNLTFKLPQGVTGFRVCVYNKGDIIDLSNPVDTTNDIKINGNIRTYNVAKGWENYISH